MVLGRMDFLISNQPLEALVAAAAEVDEAKLILDALSSPEGVNSCISAGKYSGCSVFHLAVLLEIDLAINVLKWLGAMDIVRRETIHCVGQYWDKTSIYATGSVLHCAVQPTPDLKMGHPDIVQAVLELPFVDSGFMAIKNKGGYNALFTASNPPNETDVQKSIIDVMSTKEGFATALNALSSNGASIFQWVVEVPNADCWKVVTALSATGVVSDATLYNHDRWGQCALYWAGSKGHLKAVQALLDIPGYDLMKHLRLFNVPDKQGQLTPYRGPLVGNIHVNKYEFLHLVVTHPQFDISFFEERDTFSDPDVGKKTLLEHAVARNALDCVAVLYNAGARVSMYQLLPTLCGAKHIPSIVGVLKEMLRHRFTEDFERIAPGVIEVVGVEHNAASDVLGRHLQADLLRWSEAHYNQSPSLRFLWHASAVPDVILNQGVNNNFSSMSMNVYGVGVYFATDAKLAAAYSTPNEEGVYTILSALTMLGNVGVKEPLILCETETTDTAELAASMKLLGVDLTQPQHRNPPIGCDSTTGPHHKEVVIYSNSSALPLFAVKYKVCRPELLNNPYHADTLSRENSTCSLQYLRPLDQVPALLRCEGDICIDEDARLLPMGTFPITRREVIELKRRIQTDGYVVSSAVTSSSTQQELWTECLNLRTENEWLKAEIGRLQLVDAENQKLKAGIERQRLGDSN